jgi:hypothetical protein
MHRRFALLMTLLLVLSGTIFISLTAVSASPAQAKDANCSDFSSQAAAQNYFINHGGPNSDPEGLDEDGDGIACESNPCPCSNNTGGGGGGGGGTGGGGGGGGGGPKPPHKFQGLGGGEPRANHFVIYGKIPTFKNGRFQVQRKVASSAFRTWKFARTNRAGKFRTPIVEAGKKKTCFPPARPRDEEESQDDQQGDRLHLES